MILQVIYFPVEAKIQTNSKYLSVLCLLKAFNTYITITGYRSSPLAWKSTCLLFALGDVFFVCFGFVYFCFLLFTFFSLSTSAQL